MTTTHEELLEENRLIRQLSQGVAHDLYHVLGIIKNYAKFIQRDTEAGKAIGADIRVIQDAVTEGEEMAYTLAACNPDDALLEEPVDLNQIIMDLSPLLRTPSIQLQLKLDPDLPKLLGSKWRNKQVLMNLGLNAHDAMPDGGVLYISTSNERDHICLSVADTGKGMSSKTLARCLEPYYSTKPKGVGTGLGLAGVANYIRNRDGEIEIKTSPKGTTFRLHLN